MIAFNLIAERLAAPLAAKAEARAENPADLLVLFAVLLLTSAPAWFLVVSRLRDRQSPLSYEGRRPIPWQGIDVLVVSLLTIFIQVLLPLVLLRFDGIRLPADGKVPAEAVVPFLVDECLAILCSFLAVAAWLAVRARAGWKALGFDLRHWLDDLMSGLTATAFIVPPVLILHAVLALVWPWPSEHPLVTSVLENPNSLPVAAIMAVLLAPLLEEFVFRVVLQGWLESVERSLSRAKEQPHKPRSGPLWVAVGSAGIFAAMRFARGKLPAGTVAIVISSALFAAMHIGHGPDPVPLFILALVLGYLYHQTHRIWPSLIVHMSLNGLTTTLLWTMLNK